MSYEFLLKLVGCNSICCFGDYSYRVVAGDQNKAIWSTDELQRTKESRGNNARQCEHCWDYSGEHFDSCLAANCAVGGPAWYATTLCRRVKCFQSLHLVSGFAIFWSDNCVPHTHVRAKTQCSEKSIDWNTLWATTACPADRNGAPRYWSVLHHI